MADRVKYFLLGMLFLVVAGVIAYDRWNSEPIEVAKADAGDTDWAVDVGSRTLPLQVNHEPEVTPVGPLGREPVDPVGQTPPNARPPVAQDPVQPRPQPVVVPPAPPPAPKEEPAAAPRTHVIQRGETLEGIALKYYGSRKGIAWIVEANKLADADHIYEKQKLIIPASKETGTKRKPEVVRSRTVPSRYEVKAGDGDLYAICRRFYGSAGEGARVARIMELNHLWSADVKAGTVLTLPPK